MKDLKKALKDLEDSKSATLELLSGLREKLGESVISRLETAGSPDFQNDQQETAGDNPYKIRDEKRTFQKEIADAEESIKSIEADLRRLGALEDEINRREREKNEKAKALAPVCTELGRLILTHPGFEHYSTAFEKEMNDLSLKVDFQQKKLDELENADGNLVARFTNSVKGIVTKAMLSKNEADLGKFMRTVGEQFLSDLENKAAGKILPEEISLAEEGEIASQVQKGKELAEIQVSLKNEIEKFRAERRETADALDRKGSPSRRISELEIFITRTKDEIRVSYRRFGTCIRENEWKTHFPPETETEKTLEEKIASIEQSLEITEKQIEDTKTAIAIETEKAEIAKLMDAVSEKQQRINEAQAAIAEINGKIAVAEKHVRELNEKYGKE